MKSSFKILSCHRNDLNYLIEKHDASVLIPMDDMWELMIIPNGAHYKILIEESPIGYFILGAENYLLQYYLLEDFKKQEAAIFQFILKEAQIQGAFAGTFEPDYLSISSKEAVTTEIDTIFYRAKNYDSLPCPIQNVKKSIARIEDYNAVLSFCQTKVGLQGGWMEAYYKQLLPTGGVHLFKLHDEIIGIGELRPSSSSPTYANLGIMVSKELRKKGLGSYIMNQILIAAKKKNLVGICSTTNENIASQKAITKAGLAPYHKILKITF